VEAVRMAVRWSAIVLPGKAQPRQFNNPVLAAGDLSHGYFNRSASSSLVSIERGLKWRRLIIR
jgi:hypothetical protein